MKKILLICLLAILASCKKEKEVAPAQSEVLYTNTKKVYPSIVDPVLYDDNFTTYTLPESTVLFNGDKQDGEFVIESNVLVLYYSYNNALYKFEVTSAESNKINLNVLPPYSPFVQTRNYFIANNIIH